MSEQKSDAAERTLRILRNGAMLASHLVDNAAGKPQITPAPICATSTRIDGGARPSYHVSCQKSTPDVDSQITYSPPSLKAYKQLGQKGYQHKRINHSARIYVDGDVHTQTIEGFFGLFKNGVRGAYPFVSQKWLQGYLNEYVWRYNRRDSDRSMFHDLLAEAVR